MKTTLKIILTICFVANLYYAQPVYELPFASENNSIEIVVKNVSSEENFTGRVELQSSPKWLSFESVTQEVKNLPANGNASAFFTFNVDDEAEVQTKEEIIFNIIESNGSKRVKKITVSVSPPDNFELFQNYPNPFNPTTIISYQLPVESKVNLKIYNILGQQAAELVNETMKPGKHKVTWNASSFASGMYIYQLVSENLNGEQNVVRKKMLVVK
jgi:hypothetical protein